MSRALLAFLFAPLVIAQETKPTGPPPPMVRMRAAGVQQLIATWPTTRIGKLFADAEVAPVVTRLVDDFADAARRRDALRLAAVSSSFELEPWVLASMIFRRLEPWDLFTRPLAEVTHAELMTFSTRNHAFVLGHGCTPRSEGRWTSRLEREVAVLRHAESLAEVDGAKLEGSPAFCFETKASDEMPPGHQQWFAHMPGLFVQLTGKGDPDGVMRTFDLDAAPGVAVCFDSAETMLMFERSGHTPEGWKELGFDSVSRVEWRHGFAGGLLLDEFEVIVPGDATGLIGALVRAEIPPPAQPLPEGALAQLRCSLHMPTVAALLRPIAAEIGVPPKLLENLLDAMNGGIAIGCCEPPPGGLIPRCYLSLGIADREAIDALLQFLPSHVQRDQVEYEGVSYTVCKISGAPAGLQPSYCFVDGVMHLAESPRSLREFLKLRQQGGDAMAVGDTPVPDGPGEIVGTIDVRFDEARLYRAYHSHWLRPLELAMADEAAPLVMRDDLPEPDTIDEYCGFGRGVLRRDGKRYVLQQHGTFGGLETTVMAFLWPTAMGPAVMSDHFTDRISAAIAKEQLTVVGEALRTFGQREGRRPKDLAELFAAQRLPADALLLPGDRYAEPLTLPNGSTARSSYRYFPEGCLFRGNSKTVTAVLIEIRPLRNNRAVLDAEGAVVQEWYAGDGQKAVDDF